MRVTKRTGFEIGLVAMVFIMACFLFTQKKNTTEHVYPDVVSTVSETTLLNSVAEIQSLTTIKDDADEGFYQIDAGLAELVIDTVISIASDAFLEKGLSTMMRYTREDLLRIRDVKMFAKNATKKATLVDLKESNLNAPIDIIEFSNATDNGADAVLMNGTVSESAHKITASFDASDYGGSHVIVRWYNIDTQSLLSFSKQPINAHTQT